MQRIALQSARKSTTSSLVNISRPLMNRNTVLLSRTANTAVCSLSTFSRMQKLSLNGVADDATNAMKPNGQRLRFLSSSASSAAEEVFVMNVPSMGDSITEGTIVNWLKNVGDLVKDDEAFVVVETDKVSVDLTATKGGVIEEVFAKKGDTIRVGNPLVKFRRGGAAGASSGAPAPQKEAAAPPKPSQNPAQAPAAPKEAVAPKDAPAPPKPAQSSPSTASAPSKPAAAPASQPSKSAVSYVPQSAPGARVDRRVKMTPIRKRIAERLLQSQVSTARLTTFNEVDMSKLFEMRANYKDAFQQKYGQKLGFMSAFVAATTKTLQEIPAVNASIDGDEIVYHDYVDMSIAVSGPRGLVVPVLRNAEQMSFAQIEQGIAHFAEKAKNDTLTLEEMAGGTFTITNGGVFGSLLSTPIINMPQSAILGMHNVVKRPVVVTNENKKEEIVIRPIMQVALSYDHRIIDGRESVTFLKTVKEKLEDPVRLLLGV